MGRDREGRGAPKAKAHALPRETLRHIARVRLNRTISLLSHCSEDGALARHSCPANASTIYICWIWIAINKPG